MLATVAISLMSWLAVGGLHVLTRIADTAKYQLPNPVTGSEIAFYLVAYSVWSVLSVLTITILQKPVLLRRWFIVILMGLGGSLVWLPFYFSVDFVISVVAYDIQWADYQATMQSYSARLIFFYAVLYVLNFVVCLSVIFASNARQAQRENRQLKQRNIETELALSENKMQLLQSQLSPHFLFNCLSGISALARNSEKEKIVQAVAQVGSLLRFTISNARQSLVPLVEELTFINNYLALQHLRYPDRFSIDMQIDEGDKNCFCPPFFIQPILENVFTHAIEQSEEQVDIALNVTVQESRLSITVSNSIPETQRTVDSLGSALANLESRLGLIYTDDFIFSTIHNNGNYQVTMNIPASGADDNV